jgi:hypothetical protein
MEIYILASARLIDIIKLITQPTSKPNLHKNVNDPMNHNLQAANKKEMRDIDYLYASVRTIPAPVPVCKLHYSVGFFKFVPAPDNRKLIFMA